MLPNPTSSPFPTPCPIAIAFAFVSQGIASLRWDLTAMAGAWRGGRMNSIGARTRRSYKADGGILIRGISVSFGLKSGSERGELRTFPDNDFSYHQE